MVLYQLLRPIAIILCRALFKLEVHGQQHVPRRGAFILVSNHTSYLDPVILGIASPRPLHFLARADLFERHALSGLVRSLGALPLDRRRPSAQVMKDAMRKLQQGFPVCLFPEGTRSNDGRLQKPKTGVGLLPRGSTSLRLEKIRVAFGRPLLYTTTPLQQASHQAIADDVMRAIASLANPRSA